MMEKCSGCGMVPGQCVEARDAGNFVISVFLTKDGPSHVIPVEDLHLYDMRFCAILVSGPRLVRDIEGAE